VQPDHNGLTVADYALLGQIVTESTFLEECTLLLIRCCVGDAWLADLFSVDSQWQWRYDKARLLVRGVVGDEDASARDAALQWLDRTKSALDERNRIVHTAWSRGQDHATGNEVTSGFKVTARRKPNDPNRPIRLVTTEVSELEPLVGLLLQLRNDWLPVYEGVLAVCR
jgi:hypothetical protein